MYKLKWSEVIPKNVYWATTNNAVFKETTNGWKNHYLMEANLNVDNAREIKELTQKSPQ